MLFLTCCLRQCETQGHNRIPSANQRSGGSIQQGDEIHIREGGQHLSKGLNTEIKRGSLGLQNRIQDTQWHVSLCVSLWKGISPIETRAQGAMGPEKVKLGYSKCREARKLQLNKLVEWRFTEYENAKLYKERTKRWHDNKICKKDLAIGQRVLLFNSHLRLFLGKLKSRWSKPFVVCEVFLHGEVQLMNEDGSNVFKVNEQRVKPYYGGSVDRDKETIDLGRQA
ncbi:uncharacterized protein LOC120081003 [Benincasa hispida]|uniref:uncharacterized protein LOC120081003 n=1 Tax=Benincasa hispida TaxID=102211 RepID=UPI00190184BA|nr:uncharacterized protein LOC120081003 [Benincasa hispida]